MLLRLNLVFLHTYYVLRYSFIYFFFFNDTATTEIYTLSLHDALPISQLAHRPLLPGSPHLHTQRASQAIDRKSTRLNSSHRTISYAVFCLKKKKKNKFKSLFIQSNKFYTHLI